MSWRDAFGYLARTVESVFPGDEELDRILALGRPLRVKYGIDITSTSVTIGNEIGLRILGRFQELGHVAVLILGDFTTLVGDPSGRDKTRPVLTPEKIRANSATWLDQIGKVLDVGAAEVRRNSEWLSKLGAGDLLRVAGQVTVAQMLERDSFANRYAAQAPIHLHEFLYCLLQGYDSIAVRADIELGGTDQTFNLNMGRTLQKSAGQAPQVCVINPLLEGVDGSQKMSKSLGNAIGIDSAPKDMFGLATRVPDALVGKYLRLATDVSDAEVERLLGGEIWEAKKAMAAGIVARHYGEEAGHAAREEFERVFAEGELPETMPAVVLVPGEHALLAILREAFGLSGGEAKRLCKQGAVSLDGARLTDPQTPVRPKGGEVLRAGRRRFARLDLVRD